MNDLQDRCYEMLNKVGVFRSSHDHLFTAGSVARELSDRISSGMSRLNVLAPHQLAHSRDARLQTAGKNRARKALLATLNRTVKTAQFIASGVPGFDEAFQLPRGESDAAILYTARQFVERATPSAALFIRFSMPADFIDDMNTHIRNIEQAMENRSAILRRLKESTAAIDAGIKECMNALFKLDIVMANTLRDDPVTQAGWNAARHVKRAAQKKKAASANAGNEGDSASS